MAERTADVEIFGERYTLRATDSPEYLQRVAEYVDGKFHEVAKESPTLVPSKVAVLASLNIADELFKRIEELRRVEREMVARIDGIVDLLRQAGATV
jgi:cell division protein ZapA